MKKWQLDVSLGLVGANAPTTSVRVAADEPEDAVRSALAKVISDPGFVVSGVGDLRWSLLPLPASLELPPPDALLAWSS